MQLTHPGQRLFDPWARPGTTQPGCSFLDPSRTMQPSPPTGRDCSIPGHPPGDYAVPLFDSSQPGQTSSARVAWDNAAVASARARTTRGARSIQELPLGLCGLLVRSLRAPKPLGTMRGVRLVFWGQRSPPWLFDSWPTMRAFLFDPGFTAASGLRARCRTGTMRGARSISDATLGLCRAPCSILVDPGPLGATRGALFDLLGTTRLLVAVRSSVDNAGVSFDPG